MSREQTSSAAKEIMPLPDSQAGRPRDLSKGLAWQAFIRNKNSASYEIIETFAYLALGVVLAVASYAALGAVLGTKNPIVTVVSYSMVPTLTRGDLLILEGVQVNQITTGRENGTIIVYYHAPTQRLIVHRVWKINPDGTVRTWGDNNPAPDPWSVQPDWIRGKMVLRVPYLGYPRLLLKDYLGF
ncbi:Uncharacterised protein [uncultured archaeon]|nr:Uncharacterised protein [uncultured archaeon]